MRKVNAPDIFHGFYVIERYSRLLNVVNFTGYLMSVVRGLVMLFCESRKWRENDNTKYENMTFLHGDEIVIGVIDARKISAN